MNIPNILSTSVIFLYIIPFILYLYTRNQIHFRAFLGAASTTVISEGIKYLLIRDNSPRPKGAKDCDLLCKDGNQEGMPGMPSSHSALVAYFAGFYYQQTNNFFVRSLLVLYAGLVMLSRYIKRCHTFNQIALGTIVGLSISWIAVRQ